MSHHLPNQIWSLFTWADLNFASGIEQIASATIQIVINVSGCNSFSCSEFIRTLSLTLLYPSHLVAVTGYNKTSQIQSIILGFVVVVVAKIIWQAPCMEHSFFVRLVAHTRKMYFFFNSTSFTLKAIDVEKYVSLVFVVFQ